MRGFIVLGLNRSIKSFHFTGTTICYSFLIALLSMHGAPVMVSGKPGIGKSFLVKDILERLSSPDGCSLKSDSILGAVFNPSTAGTKWFHSIKPNLCYMLSQCSKCRFPYKTFAIFVA